MEIVHSHVVAALNKRAECRTVIATPDVREDTGETDVMNNVTARIVTASLDVLLKVSLSLING